MLLSQKLEKYKEDYHKLTSNGFSSEEASKVITSLYSEVEYYDESEQVYIIDGKLMYGPAAGPKFSLVDRVLTSYGLTDLNSMKLIESSKEVFNGDSFEDLLFNSIYLACIGIKSDFTQFRSFSKYSASQVGKISIILSSLGYSMTVSEDWNDGPKYYYYNLRKINSSTEKFVEWLNHNNQIVSLLDLI